MGRCFDGRAGLFLLVLSTLVLYACGRPPDQSSVTPSSDESEQAQVHYRQGLMLLASGDCARAATSLDLAIQLSPGNIAIAEAWIRNDSSCRAQRNQQVLAVAAELFTAIPDAAYAEAYAMALAANGQFDRAIQLQERVVANADSVYSRDLLQRFRNREMAEEPWPADTADF
ncbi:MAG: hypothetical protein OEQ74_05875 [Gammaproteobacteria bacterium]|nr:hypothetical protein [Gammaproteobacteria bacterium]